MRSSALALSSRAIRGWERLLPLSQPLGPTIDLSVSLVKGRGRFYQTCRRPNLSPSCRHFPSLHTDKTIFKRCLSQTANVPREPLGAGAKQAFIALGSNVGNRLENIEQACREIDNDPQMRVLHTSSLYETEPMYVVDQSAFLNGACEIETTLQPIELLDKLQAIETKLGRVKLIEKGPRSVDLDILFYGNENINSERLVVPHPLMGEREFVLRPLAEWQFSIPAARNRTVKVGEPLRVVEALKQLPPQSSPIFARTPLMGQTHALLSQDPKRRTHIMSIMNMTPDSFSDGGDLLSEMKALGLKATCQEHIVNGATLIDIGGQSSRPNAADISADEEISRVLPAIESVTSLPEADNVVISIDTYRAAVADAAIKAGAHIINDISAGALDPDMFATIARLGCTYIMMHMRGTPETMQKEANCTYPDGVISTVAQELGDRVEAAQLAGIRRWRMILDPGIGFAKTAQQNAAMLRDFSILRSDPRVANLPWLVGSSRKSFIGKLTNVQDPKERIWGTAATLTAAVAGGADIVRVHDTYEMAQVVKMADAMYRV